MEINGKGWKGRRKDGKKGGRDGKKVEVVERTGKGLKGRGGKEGKMVERKGAEMERKGKW